jgi:hypothetical protein
MVDRSSSAVTEVLGLIIIVMIASSAIGVIVFWGYPYMESKKVFAQVDSVRAQFKIINDVIQEVVSKGVSGSSLVDLVTDGGQVNIYPDGERFILYYSLRPDFDFNVTDFYDDGFKYIVRETPDPRNKFNISYLGRGENVFEIPEKSGNYIVGSHLIQGFSYDLYDAVKIDIKEDPSGGVMGRIWLFDVGSITYDISSSNGIYKFVAENGGVVAVQNTQGYNYHPPIIYLKNGQLIMNVIQIKPVDITGASGANTYTFLIKSNSTIIRENGINIPEFFKMEIVGDKLVVDAWIEYFTSEYGFELASGTKDLLLLEVRPGEELFFRLVQSECSVMLRL